MTSKPIHLFPPPLHLEMSHLLPFPFVTYLFQRCPFKRLGWASEVQKPQRFISSVSQEGLPYSEEQENSKDSF
ncbi:unnamed protein product [Rhizophagus irregularis]|nr:unnamed protein product [Rhizophagus irregularis]